MKRTYSWPIQLPTTAQDVWSAPYSDFVAWINQTNVPPGAYTTLTSFQVFGRITAESRLLEVACTTGFSSREISLMTGCSAVGFDLSQDAVALAQYNARRCAPESDLTYTVADGMTFDTDERFSHIVVGAALGFFPDPSAMARRLVKFLKPGGYVLAAPFWVPHELSPEAQAVRTDVFGITARMETRADVLRHYRGMDVIYSADRQMSPEADDELIHYCDSTVDRAVAQTGIADEAVIAAMRTRLIEIKRATNLLRREQRYSVFVFRFDPSTYPRRYVELF